MIGSADTDERTDAELLEIAASGGPEADAAWRELYGRLNGKLVGWIRANTSASDTDAEDLAAEVWSRLYRHAHRYNPDGSTVASYLITIAARLAYNRDRDDGRSPVAGTFDQLAGSDDGVRWLERSTAATNGGDPADAYETRRTIRALEESLADLPPKLRRAAEGRLEGRKYREIAASEGISVGTAKSRIYRAREALAERLSERGVEVDWP